MQNSVFFCMFSKCSIFSELSKNQSTKPRYLFRLMHKHLERMVDCRRTLSDCETCISHKGFERSLEYGPNPLAERFAHSAVNYKVDGGIQNHKEVIKLDQNQESHRIW